MLLRPPVTINELDLYQSGLVVRMNNGTMALLELVYGSGIHHSYHSRTLTGDDEYYTKSFEFQFFRGVERGSIVSYWVTPMMPYWRLLRISGR